jgi:hypothetical protein
MLTIKVKMHAGYLHILGTIHDCKDIADIESQELTICVVCFNFREGGKMKTSCRMF